MQIEKTKLNGVLLIKPEPFIKGSGELFADERGMFLETYNEAKLKAQGVDVRFVEDDISVSTKGVLRGIHGDDRTWKQVSCISGSVFLVVINCDKDSAEFGKWESFDLNESNQWRVLIPPKHGNAYVALSDKVIFQYKQSSYYSPEGRFEYRWDEPKFGIAWPIQNPILSTKDRSTPYLGV